jgi:hypothetical protein
MRLTPNAWSVILRKTWNYRYNLSEDPIGVPLTPYY